MRTKLDPDDEFFIPEIDFSKVEFVPNPRVRQPGEKTEICLDGAIEYQVRLIPSTKVIGRFVSTLDAWPAVIAAIEGGRVAPDIVTRRHRCGRPALAHGCGALPGELRPIEQRWAASVRRPGPTNRPSRRRGLSRASLVLAPAWVPLYLDHWPAGESESKWANGRVCRRSFASRLIAGPGEPACSGGALVIDEQ